MNYAQELLALMKFRRKTVEDCEKAIETAGLDKYETSKIIEEWGKKEEFDPYLLTYNMAFKETLDEVSEYYKKFTDVLVEVKKEVHKREMAKLEAENKEKVNEEKKQNKDLDELNEHIKKTKIVLKNFLTRWRKKKTKEGITISQKVQVQKKDRIQICQKKRVLMIKWKKSILKKLKES